MMYDDFGSYSGYDRFEAEQEFRRKEYDRELERKQKRQKERNKVLGARTRNIKKICENDYAEFEFKLQMLEKKWRIISTFRDGIDWVAICEEMRVKSKKIELKEN